MKQEIYLGIVLAIVLGFASWGQAAYTTCKVTAVDLEKSTITMKCDIEAIEDIKVGDKIKGKKVVKKAYEGC